MLGKNKSFVIRRLSKAINIEKICPSVTEAGFPLSRYFATIAIFGHTIAISKLFNYYRARDIGQIFVKCVNKCVITLRDSS